MALERLVLRSKLIPPRQPRGVLHRRRLDAQLASTVHYPLTIVQAGTGYGKSTTLARLTGQVDRLYWYTITEPDRDPLLFLAHLICAFQREEPAWCKASLRLLENSAGQVTPDVLTPLLNNLTLQLDGEAILVLDDYHLVADVREIAAAVEHLVDHLPPYLHVVLATRQQPSLGALTRWRVKGQVLSITRADLAFMADEIEALFCDEYGYALTPEQARELATETEGWAIALQMVWQSLQSGVVTDLDAVLGRLPSTMHELFDYLAQEVLERQAPDVQRFLIASSILRQMDGATCDYLLGVQGSAGRLRQLHESGLFIFALGGEVYRYHHLFHEFLQARLAVSPFELNPEDLHLRAAEGFRRSGQQEETVFHLLGAKDYRSAARLLEEMGHALLAMGRSDSLNTWIGCVPAEVQDTRPGLRLLLGDILRLRAQFDEALEQYAAAEKRYAEQGDRLGRSRALGGQAQVYLDTVRPLKADSLLEEALRLLEPQEHREEAAALLDRLAENKLNLGHPQEAQALHHEARLLRAETDPGDVYLEARAKLRTGRLGGAQALLEARAREERSSDQARPQRFHRETLLLLSLLHSLQGEARLAECFAREGIDTGQRLGSAFVEAVGIMRLGHAVQLREWRPWYGQPASTWHEASEARSSAPVSFPNARHGSGSGVVQATGLYLRSMEQVRAFKVMRTQAEPLWGLCRACGYHGEITKAEEYAERALEIIQRTGDEWMHNLIRVTLGAGYVQSHRPQAARSWLSESAAGFAQVGDTFGQAVAWLWLAMNDWDQGNPQEALRSLATLLPLVRDHGYEWLLDRVTLLGLRDSQAALPLLIAARAQGLEAKYLSTLLGTMGLSEIEYHPGYSLYVRTLGPFAVWRGDQVVAARDWQREKARWIFQFLLTHRGQWFFREQIIDQLWPQLAANAAERDFKVALSALNRALEPNRPQGANPFFVIRKTQGVVYGLNPAARLVVDLDDFERLAAAADVDSMRKALSLYEEDYLFECLYEDWPSANRLQLQQLYLNTAERLARELHASGELAEALAVCGSILTLDNCREAAYRLQMRIYAVQGNRQQVHSVYRQCVSALQDELGVEPSPETLALFAELG